MIILVQVFWNFVQLSSPEIPKVFKILQPGIKVKSKEIQNTIKNTWPLAFSNMLNYRPM